MAMAGAHLYLRLTFWANEEIKLGRRCENIVMIVILFYANLFNFHTVA